MTPRYGADPSHYPSPAMPAIIRRRPSQYDTLRQEMDRLFTDFFPSQTDGADDPSSPTWVPRTDVVETDDAYLISMDLPGVTPEDVTVHFDDGMLRVNGAREVRSEHQDARFHQVERSYGQFFRSFRLGSDVDTEGIDATYDMGILTIEVPKAEARKPRQISVRTGTPTEAKTVRSEEADGSSDVEAEAAETASNGAS